MSQDKSTSHDAPPENVNSLPGGSNNTAGGKVRDGNVVDVIKTIKPGDFKEVHKKPCVRDAFLAGIGLGFGMGGIRAIMGGTSTERSSPLVYMLTSAVSIFNACSWAVGTFCFGSAAMHEFCQRRRKLEREGMQRVVEVIDRKKTDRQKKAEDARAARRRAKEEG